MGIRAEIHKKFPVLHCLDREDIRFHHVPHTVRFEMAKMLDPNPGWKCVGEKINLKTSEIAFIENLTKHDGSNSQNMFDFYIKHGENSLRLFRNALIDQNCQDVLSQLCIGWDSVTKEVQMNRKKPVQHHDSSERLEQSCLSCPYHSSYKSRQDGCISYSSQPSSACCQHPHHLPTPLTQYPSYPPLHPPHPQHPSHPQFFAFPPPIPTPVLITETNYPPIKHERTSDWVAKHSGLSPQPETKRKNVNKEQSKVARPKKNHIELKPFIKDEPLTIVKKEPEDYKMASLSNTNSSGCQSMDTNSSFMSREKLGIAMGGVGKNEYLQDSSFYLKKGTPMSNGTMDLPPIGSIFSGPNAKCNGMKNNEIVMTKKEDSINIYETVPFGNVLEQTVNKEETVKAGKLQQEEEQMSLEELTIGEVGMLKGPDVEKKNRTLPMSRPDEIRFLEGREPSSPQSSIDSLRRYGSSRGKMESGPHTDSLRQVTVFVTHLYHSWDPPPNEKKFSKCAVSLGKCLKENRFRIQMDVPNKNRVPQEEKSWRDWLDRKFNSATYILVCLSPSYLDVVNATHIEDPDDIVDNILSTRYIYHLMQHEFEESSAVNRRFIPILFSDIQRSEYPPFLQTSQAYKWTQDFEDLFFRLSQPDVSLTNMLAQQEK